MKKNEHVTEMTEITCAVKNCEYHCSGGICGADSIHVGPNFANSSADTVCKTFKSKDDKVEPSVIYPTV